MTRYQPRSASSRLAGLSLVSLLLGASLRADHLNVRIGELLTRAPGEDGVQYIELLLMAPDQTAFTGEQLVFANASGEVTGTFAFPSDIVHAEEGGTVLIATHEFEHATGVEPDFVLPDGLLNADAGRVCIADFDCLAYGAFTGDNETYGDPAPLPPQGELASLHIHRFGLPRRNDLDYEIATPSPTLNDGTPVAFGDDHCLIEVAADDLGAWDVPLSGEGMDLAFCGIDAFADVGSVEVENGRLVLRPGERDDLGLGAPISIVGLAEELAEELPVDGYRATFRFRAGEGIAQAAAFVRVRYQFEDGRLDPGDFAGIGVNWTFQGQGHDDISDHIHADIRRECLAEGFVLGEDEIDYPGFILTAGDEWTLTLDVRGDGAASEPAVLGVRVTPDGEPLSEAPLGVFMIDGGISPHPGGDIDHPLLLAALGAGGLEVFDVAICELDPHDVAPAHLTCSVADAGVRVAWGRPPLALPTDDILVSIDGEVVERLPWDETGVELDRVPPEGGELSISVAYGRGPEARCSVSGEAAEAHFLRGDCNGDGGGDISDAVFALNHLFVGGVEPACIEACDTNSDHAFDLSDAIYELGFLFLGGPSLAAPFPNCAHGHVEVGCAVEQCPH